MIDAPCALPLLDDRTGFGRRPWWVVDPLHGRLLATNPAAVALWGAPDLAALLARDLSQVSEAVRTRTDAQMPVIARGDTIQERCTLFPGGRAVTCDLLISGIRCNLPGERGRVVMLVEATPLQVSAQEVRAQEALRHTSALVTLFDAGGIALYRNPAATRAYPAEPARFAAGFADAAEAERLWRQAMADSAVSGLARVVTAAGERWHGVDLHRTVDPASGGASVLVNERDMTGEVEARTRVEHAALHDSLTDLANRTLFRRRLDEAVRARDRAAAVLVVDLDHFKPVNDNHGHAAGDAVLVAAAGRLRGLVRADDLVARLGGDEFAIVTASSGTGIAARRLAERVVSELRVPIRYGATSVRVGASVGVALIDPDRPAELTLRHADEALYEAKRAGRNVVRMFGGR